MICLAGLGPAAATTVALPTNSNPLAASVTESGDYDAKRVRRAAQQTIKNMLAFKQKHPEVEALTYIKLGNGEVVMESR